MDSDILKWSEFGLAGLTIGCLFASLFFIVKWMMNKSDTQEKRHHEERKEWREANTKAMEHVHHAVDELHGGIRELVAVVKDRQQQRDPTRDSYREED